eukprot:m.48983 g.48983  ORF g.48983 m.48983 type:complete len:58 (-) comp13337_c0_seq1:1324-1497(-)
MAAYRLASQDGFVGSQTRTNRHDQSQPTLEHKVRTANVFNCLFKPSKSRALSSSLPW